MTLMAWSGACAGGASLTVTATQVGTCQLQVTVRLCGWTGPVISMEGHRACRCMLNA